MILDSITVGIAKSNLELCDGWKNVMHNTMLISEYVDLRNKMENWN